MRSSVEIIQLSDGSWFLQFISTNEENEHQVVSIPFERYVFAEQAAQTLRVHVDKVRRYEWAS
jgi:hypothetical protein